MSMSPETLLSVSQRLNVSVEALAALGAELRLRRDGTDIDAGVRERLREVVAGLQPGLLDSIGAEQETVCLAFIQAFFRQALDLLENPARAAGWTYEDPIVLHAMGQASRRVVHAIDELASQRSRLRATLAGVQRRRRRHLGAGPRSRAEELRGQRFEPSDFAASTGCPAAR
jgi:hypothetical protein